MTLTSPDGCDRSGAPESTGELCRRWPHEQIDARSTRQNLVQWEGCALARAGKDAWHEPNVARSTRQNLARKEGCLIL
jgi:hypothetical protein